LVRKEFRGVFRHGHNLFLERFADAFAAAVDGGANADFGKRTDEGEGVSGWHTLDGLDLFG
jgi:hypothetical protein